MELIDAPLRSHPDVLEVRWDIYAKVKNWEACLDIGKAMVKLDSGRFTGWINRSFALHELKRTQEACDQLHEGLYRFRDESLIWYNLACYACVLGDKARARKMLDKAIELGGDKVKLQALDDPDLQGVWVSGGIKTATPAQVLMRGSHSLALLLKRRRVLPQGMIANG